MTTKIACPACGHHLANIHTSARVGNETVQEATVRLQSEVRDGVAEWLGSVPAGRYSPEELRAAFRRDRGNVDVSAKAFGQALLAAGAVPRRDPGGSRVWVVGSPS